MWARGERRRSGGGIGGTDIIGRYRTRCLLTNRSYARRTAKPDVPNIITRLAPTTMTAEWS